MWQLRLFRRWPPAAVQLRHYEVRYGDCFYRRIRRQHSLQSDLQCPRLRHLKHNPLFFKISLRWGITFCKNTLQSASWCLVLWMGHRPSLWSVAGGWSTLVLRVTICSFAWADFRVAAGAEGETFAVSKAKQGLLRSLLWILTKLTNSLNGGKYTSWRSQYWSACPIQRSRIFTGSFITIGLIPDDVS